MLEAEKIIWRVETREHIKKDHPDWSEVMIEKFLKLAEEIVFKKWGVKYDYIT